MTKQEFLSVNMMLSSGLYVFNAKFRRGTSLITLLLTDFHSNTRIVLDMDNGEVLANKHGIKLEKKDIETLVGVLREKVGGLEKKTEIKTAV